MRSELQLGIISPSSGGAETQNFVHKATPQNKEVPGWSNQIRNGPVINYNILLEKRLAGGEAVQWIGLLHTRLGTLYTDITPGFRIDIGNLPDRFSTPSGWRRSRKLRFSVYGQSERSSLRNRPLRSYCRRNTSIQKTGSQLSETGDHRLEQLKAGDVVERRIIIRASGSLAAMIPPLEVPDIEFGRAWWKAFK